MNESPVPPSLEMFRMAKAVDLTKAAATADTRRKALGPTIEVRAIARGQYGHPYARLIEKGTVFRMAIKDLGKPRGGEHPTTGLPWGRIEVEGKEYGLPSWVVDAASPVEQDEDEDLAVTVSGRPARSTQAMDSDDVL